MGWVLSPPFFCAASETAHDVAELYVAEPQGSLTEHLLRDITMTEDFLLLAVISMTRKQGAKFLYVLEVYVDNLIQMSQTDNEEALRRCSQKLLHGIHSMFPPPSIMVHVGEETLSIKKLMEGEGRLEVIKEILVWLFDGATRCIELAEKKQTAILK